jgi:hypothetical protein
MVKDALRSQAPAWLSANIVGMGYQLVAGTVIESLSEKVWLDLIALAAQHGSAAPRLGNLGRHEQVDLTKRKPQGSTQRLSEHYLQGSPPNASQPRTMR